MWELAGLPGCRRPALTRAVPDGCVTRLPLAAPFWAVPVCLAGCEALVRFPPGPFLGSAFSSCASCYMSWFVSVQRSRPDIVNDDAKATNVCSCGGVSVD